MPHRHATSLGAAVLLLALVLAGPAMADPAPAVTVTFAGVDHYAMPAAAPRRCSATWSGSSTACSGWANNRCRRASTCASR